MSVQYVIVIVKLSRYILGAQMTSIESLVLIQTRKLQRKLN